MKNHYDESVRVLNPSPLLLPFYVLLMEHIAQYM